MTFLSETLQEHCSEVIARIRKRWGVVKPVEDSIIQIQNRAYNLGYDEGYADGLAVGKNEGYVEGYDNRNGKRRR